MFTVFERMLAFRYLRSRKAEGFVSVIAGFSFLGIMLGVATLIIVMAVMNGFRAELISRILGLNGHITLYDTGGQFQDYETLRAQMMKVTGVTAAIPMVERQSLLSVNGASTGVLVRGLEMQDFKSKPVLSESLVAGKPDDFYDDVVLVGSELAKRYRLAVGDQIQLISPQAKASPFGSMPRKGTFTVAGVFDVEMYEYNSGFVFMPIEMAQRFYQMPQAANVMELFLNDPNISTAVSEEVLKALPITMRATDWKDANGSFFNALQVERNVMFLILTLIILVAAFNIISSMIMLVKDKGRDIAILRTMGATRRSVLKIFILTGSFIGFVGTAVGAIFGISFAMNIESIRKWLESLTGTELFSAEIYYLSQLPAELNWGEVVAVVGMAFTLSLLATLYPAWRAARLDPVEALRYE